MQGFGDGVPKRPYPLLHFVGAGGELIAEDDAELGEDVGVDIQARLGDDLIRDLAGLRFALEDLGGHQTGLAAEGDIIEAFGGDAAELDLLSPV